MMNVFNKFKGTIAQVVRAQESMKVKMGKKLQSEMKNVAGDITVSRSSEQ